jgi:hypothetical protein
MTFEIHEINADGERVSITGPFADLFEAVDFFEAAGFEVGEPFDTGGFIIVDESGGDVTPDHLV